jgi:serine/threonine protein kinase
MTIDSIDPRLLDLVMRYEERAQQGQPVTPEELCSETPELLEPLKRHLAALERAANLLGRTAETADSWATQAPEAKPLLSKPEQIPGYTILGEIGRGGMGVVYRARDERLNRDVAVKLLADDVPANSPPALRFLVEAKITGQLQHPGIPAVHELGQLPDGRPFLAMKLVKGQTLQNLLSTRVPPSPLGGRGVGGEGGHDHGRYLAIFESICQAVGYAHAHRVIHRDMKPLNVMVGAFGEVQVMDWGLAKVLTDASPQREQGPDDDPWTTVDAKTAIDTPQGTGSETRTGSILGTPAYMPPEQAGGEIRKLDARSDVFGLGAILCQILTGRPPYQGKDRHEVQLLAVRGELADAFARLDASGAEPELVALCKRCLAFRKEDRPADGGEVANAVAALRAAADERARRAEVERGKAEVQAAEQRRRKRAVQWAAAVVGTVLIAGIIGTTVGLQRAEDAHQDALRNEEWARDSVNRYFTAVSEDPDLEAEGLEPLRRRLLLTAKDYYVQFVRERSQDKMLCHDLAAAHYRLGRITQIIGDKQEAILEYEQANTLWLEQDQHDPGRAHYQRNLIASHNNLGTLYRETARVKDAEAAYDKALALSQDLAGAYPNVSDYQSLLADCHANLARLYLDMSQPAKAETSFVKALALRQSLADTDPGDREWKSELASGLISLGNLYSATRRQEDAEAAYERARVICQQRADAHPAVRRFQTDLALSHACIARLFSNTGRPKEAELAFQQALTVYQQLASVHPKVAEYQSNLAGIHEGLGVLFHNTRRFGEARTAHLKALTLRQSLADAHPNAIEEALSLGGSQGNIARLAKDTGQLAEALKWYDRCLTTLEAVLLRQDRHPQTRQYVHNTHVGRAEVLTQLGRYTEALQAWDQAIASNDHVQDAPRLRLHRALTLVRTGDHIRAVSEGAVAADTDIANRDTLYDVACLFALASAAVKDDAKLREQHTNRALDFLTKAIAQGFRNVQLMKEDSDLDSLRGRDDFKKLLAELEAGKDKK